MTITKQLSKVLSGIAVGLLAGAAQAGVVMEQNIALEGAGGLSMLGATGRTTTLVSGQRGRTESRMEMNSGLLQKFAGDTSTASIVRMDDEKVINLMPEQQAYSEMSFEEMRAQMRQAMDQMSGMQQGGGLPVSEDECQWSDPVIDVKKTGKSEQFAGVDARQVLVTASQTCTVPSQNKSCDMTFALEYWMAEGMPGGDEIRAFQRGMAEAMGADEQLAMASMQARGMLAMFKEGWEQVLDESGGFEGFPAKSVMTMEMGGENCTTPMGQPIAMDDVWGQAANAGLNAASSAAAYHASAAVGEAIADSVGDSVGGSIAGSAVGAASREAIGGLFRKFSRKRKEKEKEKEQQAAQEQAAQSAGGSVVLFRVSSELTRIEVEPIPDSAFEVPAGWKRVDSTGF